MRSSRKQQRTTLHLEVLEARTMLDATSLLLPALPPVAVAAGEAAAASAGAAAAAAGGAAGPPVVSGGLGVAAGYAKAAANAVTTNWKSEEITAASNHPQPPGGAFLNYLKAVALALATNTKTFLDYADATADSLVQGAKTSPSPASTYLGLVGASYKAGEAGATLSVDEAVIAWDTAKDVANPTPENDTKVVSDGINLRSDVKDNFAFNVTVDLTNANQDAQEAAKAASALQAATSAFFNTLSAPSPQPAPPPTLAPTPTPAPTPAPTPTPIPQPVPKGPAAAMAGTYSGAVKPSNANDLPLPKDPMTTSRQIKLTINPDGSGSLSVAPFEDQTVFTLAFTANVTHEDDGTFTLGADVPQGNGFFTFDLIGAEVANRNQLDARNLALTDDTRGLEVSFDNLSLNRN